VLFETLAYGTKLFDALLDFDDEEEAEITEEQAHQIGNA
jgi:hypothetical protein